jgi:uncharacterized protein (DUF2249 family)
VTELDVRDLPPAERHDRIFEAFESLSPGESLTLVNDHDPKPLYHQFVAEVPAFDADGYEVTQRGPEEYVATFPKHGTQPPSRVTLSELDGDPGAPLFPGEEPKAIHLTLDPGEAVARHDHPGRDVLFLVRSGDVELTLGGDSYDLTAGDVVRFDGEKEVAPRAGDEGATALVVLAARVT